MDHNKLIGERIRDARKRLGLSQQKLAIKMDLSYQQIQKYERGHSNFKPHRLKQLAEALGMTIEDLIGVKEMPQPKLDKAEAELLALYKKIKSPAKQKKLLDMAVRLARLTHNKTYL